jgi:tetratricopeptide (TPR) repeat protein
MADIQNKNRVIRVFISSTFRDMQEERDVLVKWVIPEVRRRCYDRLVELVEVDLRWGITEAQAQKGETISVCLDEIDRCRPYFIGMLGERYGWIPDSYKKDLLEVQPWIQNHLDKSVTELEFIYGFLKNKTVQDQAFIYFRDKDYGQKVPSSIRPLYLSEGPESKRLLNKLKDDVRNSGASLKEIYKTPEEFGEFVLEDLWEAINKDFPAGSEPTALEIEANKHETFANVRRSVYIGREDYYSYIDNHIETETKPLVIQGDSGSGKSALLANWILRYQNKNPEDLVFLHFVGGTGNSSDHLKLVQRLMETIQSWGLYNESLPTEPSKMIEMLPTWLTAAGANRKIMIVIDALNQLEDRNGGQDLGWLPHQLPKNIHLVLSTLPGKVQTLLSKRNYPFLIVKPFDPKERKGLILNYLDQYRKRLPDPAVEKLIQAKNTENPLFLKTVLAELRIMGVHEELDKRIAYYLSAKNIESLYEKMLERMESDFDRSRKYLVRDCLFYLWCSRRGLSESELLDLLGTTGKSLPRAYLSPFLLALEHLLLNTSGIITFAHDRLRIAVMNRYAQSGAFIEDYRRNLCSYFREKEELDRSVDEIPYQLSRMRNWTQMHSYIRQIPVFEKAFAKDKLELLSNWFLLGDFYNMDESYRVALQSWEGAEDNADLPTSKIIQVITDLGSFLCFSGSGKSATILFERAYEIALNTYGSNSEETASCMSQYGRLLLDNGKYHKADKLLREAFNTRLRTLGPEHRDTLMSMDELALLEMMQGHYKDAEILYQKGYEISKKILGATHPGTMESLNGLALLYLKKGEYQNAKPIQEQAYLIFDRNFGKEHPDTLALRTSYAFTLCEIGEVDQAVEHYRSTLSIYESCFGPEHPGTLTSLSGLSHILELRGDIEEAEKLLYRVHSTQKRTLGGEHPETINTQALWARLLLKKDEISTAESHFREVLYYRERLLGKEHPDTMDSMYDLSQVLTAEKEYLEADPIIRECYQLRKQVLGGDHEDTLLALIALSDITLVLEDFENAEDYLKQVIRLEKAKVDSDLLAIARVEAKLGRVLSKKGNHLSAVSYYKRSLAGKEKVLEVDHVESIEAARALGFQFSVNKEFEKAEEILKKALNRIRNKIEGDQILEASILHTMGSVYENDQDYKIAIDCYGEALQIRKICLGEKDVSCIESLVQLGSCRFLNKDYVESCDCFSKVLEIGELYLTPENEKIVYAQSYLGASYYHLGDYPSAQDSIAKALKIRLKNDRYLPISQLIEDLDNMSRIQIMLGIYNDAEGLLTQSLTLKQKHYGREHHSVSDSLELLGFLHLRQASFRKAEKCYRRVTALRRRESGLESFAYYRSLEGLAIASVELENYSEALDLFSSVVDGFSKLFLNGHKKLFESMCGYVFWLDQCERTEQGAACIGKIIRYAADSFVNQDSEGYREAILNSYSLFQDHHFKEAWDRFLEAQEMKDPMSAFHMRLCQSGHTSVPC